MIEIKYLIKLKVGNEVIQKNNLSATEVIQFLREAETLGGQYIWDNPHEAQDRLL